MQSKHVKANVFVTIEKKSVKPYQREPCQIRRLNIPIKILQPFNICLKLYQVNPKTSITLRLFPVCDVFNSTADERIDVLIRRSRTHFTV